MARLWTEIFPSVFLFRDSCSVYAVVGPDGVLIVDAGTGAWLDALHDLPGQPVALACTHYFRDHAAGALRAAEAGIPVYVPEGEEEIFVDPVLHFQRRESYIVYTNTWDHFAPIEPTPIAGLLRDYERRTIAGLVVEVVPLPGATITQAGLQVDLPQAGRLIFCGETIHSQGRVPRLAPLQYGYLDLSGGTNVISSSRELRRRRPDALLPSLGEPITDGVDDALAQLELNLRAHGEGQIRDSSWKLLDAEPFAQVSASVWRTAEYLSMPTFIVASSGRILVIDYGYDIIVAAAGNGDSAAAPHRRRGSLRLAREFVERQKAERIDIALVSHYHDDHVASIPLLQRVYGTECWCPDWFADILERPADFAFPCTWPVPIEIHRRIRADESLTWEGINFQFATMSGHTRFSAAIGFEIDGIRFAHTGDQYHSLAGWQTPLPLPRDWETDWEEDELWNQGHVYRNGAFLRSFAESARWLLDWRPEILLTGHQPAMRTSAAFFRRLLERTERYEEAHLRSMVLGDDEVHFELDSWGGWIRPYRSFHAGLGAVTVVATVRNPLPVRAKLDVALVGPRGWKGSSAALQAEPRGETSCELTILPAGPCRRQPIAVELTANGRRFGQVAEALVTIGGERF